MILDILFFIIACIVLVQSNNLLVKSLSKLSSILRLTEFSLGFILVAIATSLPEMFVGIMSAIEGTPSLSVGNVIGSNIADLTLVIGIAVLLAKNINIDSTLIKKDMVYMLLITMLPVILLVDHLFWNFFGLFPNMIQGLSRLDGLILLLVFAKYIYNLIKQEQQFSKKVDSVPRKDAFKYLLFALLSLTFLLVTSNFVVKFAQIISIDLNISPLMVGIFLVAVGTSLPELVFTSKAVMTEHQSMAIGDLIGSVIANSTLVLGITAIITPVIINAAVYLTSTLFMVFSAFIFFTFAESDNKITWYEGISLLMLYVLFIVIEFYVKSLSIA